MAKRETMTERRLREAREELRLLKLAASTILPGEPVSFESELAESKAKVAELEVEVAKATKRNAASRLRNETLRSFGLVRTRNGGWE